MKHETKKFLLKKRVVYSIPVKVKFKKKEGGVMSMNAKKGEYFIKLSDVYKALNIEKEEIKKLIKKDNNYTMGNILDKDIMEWLR